MESGAEYTDLEQAKFSPPSLTDVSTISCSTVPRSPLSDGDNRMTRYGLIEDISLCDEESYEAFTKSSTSQRRRSSREQSLALEICFCDPLLSPPPIPTIPLENAILLTHKGHTMPRRRQSFQKILMDHTRPLSSNLTALLRRAPIAASASASISRDTAEKQPSPLLRSKSLSSTNEKVPYHDHYFQRKASPISASCPASETTTSLVHMTTYSTHLGKPSKTFSRSHRLNSDFLRLLAFETEMRRQGKLEMELEPSPLSASSYSIDVAAISLGSAGKAKMFLDPRRDNLMTAHSFNRSRTSLYN